MLIDVVLLAVAVVLAGGAYFFKRQAGTLLLLVMAGGLLSVMAAQKLTAGLATQGVTLTAVPTEGAVAVGLILLPAVLGWFAAPKTHTKLRRLLGAVLFGIVAATLVAGHASTIFDSGLVSQAKSLSILQQQQAYIIAAGLLFAMVDLFLGRGKAPKDDGKK